MSRSKTSTHDSLDLLLDTICNTFGGVLFISLLVVILLNMSSRTVSLTPPSEVSQQELSEQREQMLEQQRRLESLSRTAEQRRRAIEQFSDPDAQGLAEEHRQRQSELEDLLEERNRRAGDIAGSQEQINQTLQELQDLQEQLAAARARHAALAAELAQEREQRLQTAELPRQQSTTKIPAVFLLQQGRLCAYTAAGPGGQFIPNDREHRVMTDADGEYVQPILENGLRVDPAGGNVDDIMNRFNEFNSSAHFILVAVWPDSFAEAAVVRDAAVRAGFQYTLRPFQENDRLRFGGSQQPVHVQ